MSDTRPGAHGGVLTLSVPAGETRQEQEELLETHLGDLPEFPPDRVVIDLQAVPYLGSSTLALLLGKVKTLRDRGADVEVVVGSAQVARTLALTRVDQIVKVRQVRSR